MARVLVSTLLLALAILGTANPLSPLGSLWSRSTPYPDGHASRIVGGGQTPSGGFPYQISLQIRVDGTNYVNVCGGSIVAQDKVVTAAHCLSRNQKYRVVAGILDLNEVEETQQYRDACSFSTHPNFNRTTRDYDYGVIRLCTPFQFNSAVGAIKLAKVEPSSSEICHTSGWGLIQTHNESLVQPTVLHNVSLPIVPRPACAEEYAQMGLNITQRVLCSGGSGKGICYRDDGSGLVCEDGTLVGIALYGGSPCGKAPSLFANVAEGKMWLDSQ